MASAPASLILRFAMGLGELQSDASTLRGGLEDLVDNADSPWHVLQELGKLRALSGVEVLLHPHKYGTPARSTVAPRRAR